MRITELKELIITKLGIKPWELNNEPFGVRFDYRGSRYFVDINLMVEKVDGACLVTDSDARQLEKLLRGEQWDGTGLPPVGAVIEVNSRHFGWIESEVIAVTPCHLVTKHVGKNGIETSMIHTEIDERGVVTVIDHDRRAFRPLRTERDKAIEKLQQVLNVGRNTHEDAENLYDAIVAGKIDGLGKVG